MLCCSFFMTAFLNNGLTAKFFVSGDNRYPSNIIWKSDFTFPHTKVDLVEVYITFLKVNY